MSGLNSNSHTVAKTTKLFIGGEFPRTESGRSFPVFKQDGKTIYTHLCQASRKDLRNAVEQALKAYSSWSGRTAYNRAQILYRMAEMLEGKKEEILRASEQVHGLKSKNFEADIMNAIDTLVYYAGFADKYSQVMASVNPVSGPFHNFTTPEPVGVVGIVSDQEFSVARFFSLIASVIASGNTCVCLLEAPGAALLSEFGEVFKTSDLPAGVVNLLSGSLEELESHLGQHMEVHSLLVDSQSMERVGRFKEWACDNMKRTVPWKFEDQCLESLVAFTESKTVWHPVGI